MEKKSFRIRTTAGGEDTYLTLKLDQKYDYLELLSIKINQENFYRNFSSDYGVLVGRVIANDGLGIPNANVSVFIPLTDEDENRSIISSIYPFKEIHDKNSLGISYNLLSPRTGMNVGSFPTKQQFLDDDTYIEVYEKYYKYTTKTNSSGDYMIFGVPVGTNNLHMDLDLSDIGEYSFTANDLIASGVSEKLFRRNSTDVYDFLESNELEVLPQIMIQNTSVDIKPLWGNIDENEIGITRYDFKVVITANPIATFVVNYGIDKYTRDTSGVELMNYNGRGDGITGSNANSPYAPGHINNVYTYINDGSGTNFGEPYLRIVKYDRTYTKNEEIGYVKIIKNTTTTNQGCIIAYLPCDQDRYITDEFGDKVKSPDDSQGIGTSGRYDIDVLLMDGNDVEGAYWSHHVQNIGLNQFKKNFRFEAKRIYSVAMKNMFNTTNQGLSPYPYALRATQDVSLVKYPNFHFGGNDWLNCFLYFGRVGNNPDRPKSQQSEPLSLLYETNGRRYYKTESRFIDITDYFDILSDQVNDHYCEIPNNDTRFTNISITPQDNPLLAGASELPETSPSRNNARIFLLGTRNNINNFKTFKRNIKR